MSDLITEPMVHVMFQGYSHDFALAALDVGDLSTDQEIFSAVASQLNVPDSKFANYTLDRTGPVMQMYPQAPWGLR